MIRIFFIFLTILYIFDTALLASKADNNRKLVKEFIENMAKKELTIKDYFKYINDESLYEYPNVLSVILNNPNIIINDPNSYSNLELKQTCLFLKYLKEWLIKNKYSLNEFKIFDYARKGEVFTGFLFKVLLGNRALYFVISIEDRTSLYKIATIFFDKTMEINIFDKMVHSYKKKIYHLQVSSERKKYPAKYIEDGVLQTTWVAGKNKGIGEKIIFKFFKEENVKYLYIYNGYAKNRQVFINNNRVKEMRIEYENTKKNIVLKDDSAIQRFSIDERTKEIKITILDVYEGEKYPEDTCISELGTQVEADN